MQKRSLTKSTFLHDKSHEEIRNRELISQQIKAIYDKTIVNIVLSRKSIPSKVMNGPRLSTLSTFFYYLFIYVYIVWATPPHLSFSLTPHPGKTCSAFFPNFVEV
jgi:hypothetical protein